MERVKVLICLVAILSCSGPFQLEGKPDPRQARFPESRSYSPGNEWLKWTAAERTGFVRGFIVGHGDGFYQGCIALPDAANDPSASSKQDTCLQKQHLFKKDLPYYEQYVTDLYTRYLDDRDVPLKIVLLQADQRTVDEVHNWLKTKTN